jgi:hypothetical protein
MIDAKEIKINEVRKQMLLCFKFISDLVYHSLLPHDVAEDVIETIINENHIPSEKVSATDSD